MTPGSRDRGSATVYVLAGCLVIGLGAIVPIVTGAVALARHRAAVAADAAALAAARTADVAQLPDARPAAAAGLAELGCRQAAAVARADHGSLTSCVVIPCGRSSESLQVSVMTRVGWAGVRLPGGSGVSVSARAGDARCLAKSPP